MPSRIVTLREVTEGVYHLLFPNDGYLMCSSLMRFQEHYESPKFKGKVFDAEEYMDWYAARFGNFTYYQDVGGFNMPSCTLKKFYAGKFDPLTRKEQRILEAFKDIEEPYYIIATCKQSKTHEQDLIHEISHGLFFVNSEYRKNVKKILRGHDLSVLHEYLRRQGYHKTHFLDECHALLLENAKNFERTGARAGDHVNVRRELHQNYDQHFIELICKNHKFRI